MKTQHKKRKKKRIRTILIIDFVLLLLAGGCIFFILNRKESDDTAIELNGNNEIQVESSKDSSGDNGNSSETSEDIDDSTITFADLAKYSYSFSSGAGGWEDDFDIEKDGYFHGSYHDSDMGDTGEDYPDGIRYYCDYEGHFENIQKVDEYTYKMQMKDITILNDDNEYIADGVKYVPLSPYALSGADEVDIYMPGKPVSEIDEQVQRWLFIDYQEQQDTLDNLALVNVAENQGIASSERISAKKEAEGFYNTTENSYEYYSDMLSEALTTADMVEITSSQVRISDDCLNNIWRVIKYNTDEAEFNKILEEQRQWLKDRDAKAQESADEYDGGSFASVAYNDTYASATMERCKKLLEYIE